MPNMLESRMVLYTGHVVFWLRCAASLIVGIVIVSATLVCEVLRSFMFVCATIVLESPDDLIDIVR